LPENIETSIRNFLDKTKLKTCSFDVIYSTDDGFYFLEVNPNGQFSWLSENCNYYIEKEIAYQLNKLCDAK
jgi:D-alanine-D-alanine ligase-like ATP-grasp enzyme